MKIIAKTLVYLISFWLVSIASLIQGYTDSPELCVVSSPLVTPYFTPWLDTPRRARGCSTLLSTATDAFFDRVKQVNRTRVRPLPHDVHAITLHVAGGQDAGVQTVKMDVEAEPRGNDTERQAFDRAVIVLNSDRPVRWILSTQFAGDTGEVVYKGTQPTVVLSEGSLVESNFNMNVSHVSWPNKKSLHRYLKKTYKGVASYSEVKGANQLRLKVGARGKPLVECELNSQEDSPVVTASYVVELQTEGCFHEDYIGDNPIARMAGINMPLMSSSSSSSSDDDDDLEIVQYLDYLNRPRRPIAIRHRPSHFEIWDEYDFFVRFRLKKETVLLLLTKIEHLLEHPTDRDVYVVELEGGGKNRNKRVGPHTLLPVMVQLLGEGTRPVPRNVTVVLKSHQPIKWQFGARRIHGNIVVVSDREDQVENSSVDGHERLEVRFKKLPDNMVELLLSVKSEYGPPIMYAKTTHASTLQMVVGAKNNNKNAGLRSGPESSVSHVMTDASGENFSREDGNASKELMQQQPNLPPQPRHTGRQELSPVVQLTAAMRVHCGRTHFNVTFPASLVRRLGSPKLTLSDPVCAARYNKTHATISSLVTSCGSTGHNDGKQFSNHVNVEFSTPSNTDDEDFESSGDAADNSGQIPLVCKYQHFFPPNHDGDHDSDHSDREVIHSLYHMVVYRDKELKMPIVFKKKGASIEVELDQILYVKAWIDGVVQVNVVTEQCWISNSSNPHLKSNVDLIRNTCPVDPSVALENDGRSPYGFFSFRVSREYAAMGLIHLHCKLGVCTRDRLRINNQNESSIVCQDPQQYCSESLRMYLDKTVSTAQQLSSRGPFKPVLKPSQFIPTLAPAIVVPAPSPQPPSGSCERVVYVGVATEVTIGIALLSFFMGVALTGALFCIHIKTDPFRRQRDKQRSTTSVGGSNGGTTASNG